MTNLPAGWAIAPLDDLVDVLDSRRVPVSSKERAQRPGPVPYYGATGPVGCIDEALFDEDLVLLGEDGVQFFDPSRPKAYVISGPAWVNNHVHVLRPGNAITLEYLHHFLNSFDYRGFANGTTRLKLTQAAMKRIPVTLPPLSEQRRIVAALDESLSRLALAESQVAQASRRLSNLERAFLRAIEEEVTLAPNTPLESLLAEPLRNGHSAPASQQGKVRTISLTAVTQGEFSERFSKMTDADIVRVRDLWLKSGDILIQRSNTPELVGTAAHYRGPEGWAVFPDLLIRIRLRAGVETDYVLMMLQSPRARRYFISKAKGLAGSMPKIDQKTIREFSLRLPEIDKQREVVRRGSSVRGYLGRLKLTSKAVTRKAAQLRTALLAAAFSGRLVPQDPNDEPASELLTRIQAERAAAPPKQRLRSRTQKELAAPPTRVTGDDYQQEALPL
ncbi:restriction endonuclease subunit S [Micromonospora sp. RB23]